MAIIITKNFDVPFPPNTALWVGSCCVAGCAVDYCGCWCTLQGRQKNANFGRNSIKRNCSLNFSNKTEWMWCWSGSLRSLRSFARGAHLHISEDRRQRIHGDSSCRAYVCTATCWVNLKFIKSPRRIPARRSISQDVWRRDAGKARFSLSCHSPEFDTSLGLHDPRNIFIKHSSSVTLFIFESQARRSVACLINIKHFVAFHSLPQHA